MQPGTTQNHILAIAQSVAEYRNLRSKMDSLGREAGVRLDADQEDLDNRVADLEQKYALRVTTRMTPVVPINIW